MQTSFFSVYDAPHKLCFQMHSVSALFWNDYLSAFGADVILLIDTVFDTSSSLVSTVCCCTSTIWKGLTFRVCIVLLAALAILSAPLALPFNGYLCTITH